MAGTRFCSSACTALAVGPARASSEIAQPSTAVNRQPASPVTVVASSLSVSRPSREGVQGAGFRRTCSASPPLAVQITPLSRLHGWDGVRVSGVRVSGCEGEGRRSWSSEGGSGEEKKPV